MAKKIKRFRKVCSCCGDQFETDRPNIKYCFECAQTQTEETGKNRIKANKEQNPYKHAMRESVLYCICLVQAEIQDPSGFVVRVNQGKARLMRNE